MRQDRVQEMDPNGLEITVEESRLELVPPLGEVQTYGPQDNLSLTLDYLKIRAQDGLDFINSAFEYVKELKKNGQKIYKRGVEGENGKGFTQYKVRTMKINADRRVNSPTYEGELEASGKPKGFRADVLGRTAQYMRKGLDELPQVWNILKREMNPVGPRPLTPDEEITFPDHYNEKRKRIKPGLGSSAYLWSNDPSPEERIEGDLRFVDLHLAHPILAQIVGTAIIAYKLATRKIHNG